MGMSSSQARLLTLTSRMHQIEYKAAKLEAQKLQMANESARVYDEYLNTLDSTKIQVATLSSNGKLDYVDANYANLIGNNLNGKNYDLIDIKTGKKFIPDDAKTAFNACAGNIDDFKSLMGIDKTATEISSAAELMALNGQTISDGNYRLTADIVISGEDWVGINLDNTTFDGNGHTITLQSTSQGLFANADHSTIQNINVDMTVFENDYSAGNLPSYFGVLADTADYSNIKNCNVHYDTDCFVEGVSGVGGSNWSNYNNISYTNFYLNNLGFDGCGFWGKNNTFDHCSFELWEESEYTEDEEFCAIFGQYNTISNCNSKIDAINTLGHAMTCYAFSTPLGRNTITESYSYNAYPIAGTRNTVRDTLSSPNDTSWRFYSEEELELMFNIMNGGTDIFTNLVNSGEVVLAEITENDDGRFNITETSVAINTELREVPDETMLRKAEAKYEADMRKIDKKERLYDHELAALDNERNAIKSEMETLKTVAKDNVERTFKLFS